MRERPAGGARCYWTSGGDARTEGGGGRCAALSAALADGALPGVEDLVPAATTILVQVPRRLVSTASLCGGRCGGGSAANQSPTRTTRWSSASHDGPDLHDVALHLGWTTGAVVAIHTLDAVARGVHGLRPRVGYLVPDDPEDRCHRASCPDAVSRARAMLVGSVAVAGLFGGLSRRRSGGWNLLGHTDFPCGTPPRTPPTPLHAGAIVRFTDLQRRNADGARTGTIRDRSGPPAERATHLGVPQVGRRPTRALRLANRLVGNPEHVAAIEITRRFHGTG